MTVGLNKQEWALELCKKHVQGNYINYNNLAFEVLHMSGKEWSEIVQEVKNEFRK